jgi:sialidase-1
MPVLSRRAALTLAASLGASLLPTTAAAAPAPARGTSSVPFISGTAGYHTFRIPAVVQDGTGGLLAFAEGRKESAGDTGAIEVVLRRSTDGGRTWGPLTTVSSNGDATAGNPSPAVLPDGDIVLLTTRNGRVTENEIMSGTVSDADTRRVFVQRSTDNGATWTTPEEITDEAKLGNWRWYATGPGHAIVLRHGRYAGRLVVPANHSTAPPAGSADTGTEQKYYGGHDLISDDGGRTWRIGFTDNDTDDTAAANETTVAELPDGTLYFNSRDQGTAPGHRLDSYSTDGGDSLLRPYTPQTDLVGPRVQGSVLQTHRGDVLLFSGPSDPEARRALSIRVSHDRGRTWQHAAGVSTAPAAYSDLVQLDRRTIGVLYETGTASPYETITFRGLPLSELSG